MELVVIIPIGHSTNPDYVIDTIESVVCYTTSERRIIIVDDSGKDLGLKIQGLFPGAMVMTTPGNLGLSAALYMEWFNAFTYAFENYSPQVILRLDADALIIGERPETDAIQYFLNDPDVGLIGSYKVDCNGEKRDFSWSGKELMTEIHWKKFLHDPLRWYTLRSLWKNAQKHGYEPGEHVQGGAYFISFNCIKKLIEHKLISNHNLLGTGLSEDHLLSLLVRSTGFKLGDFATGNYPMGIRWRGLPCSPEDLLKREKKVIHSTKFWKDMKEEEIRKIFRDLRKKSPGHKFI